jgi:IrrE N-terminal-like domain
MTHLFRMASSSYLPPTPCNLTKQAIEGIACKVAGMVAFRPGGRIAEAVTKLGGTIRFLRLDEWLEHEADTIVVEGPRKFEIRLLGADGPLRQNFTIAHELGHYILHSRSGSHAPMIAGRKGSNRVEWEANWFAASLLMPELEFRAVAVKPGMTDLTLAGIFNVSLEAAQLRKKVLRIGG